MERTLPKLDLQTRVPRSLLAAGVFVSDRRMHREGGRQSASVSPHGCEEIIGNVNNRSGCSVHLREMRRQFWSFCFLNEAKRTLF
ncbi:hypothetical protein EYF80_033912 [Liparis tanakae]|uniref:Uncharacterized protein n=1 Tax=Liparis tanakae TaxID=230148 RepID=A0A4Z2GTA9_9TELE|nr:hypothetical protein EYF80_033912 [Liparis tanakae]